MIRRIYVDGCAVGGLFTQRFGQDTKPFWAAVHRGEITVIVSDVLGDEVEKAPKIVRDFFDSLPSTIQRTRRTSASSTTGRIRTPYEVIHDEI